MAANQEVAVTRTTMLGMGAICLVLAGCKSDGDGGKQGGAVIDAAPVDAVPAGGDAFYCDSSTVNQQCTEYASPSQALVDDFKSSCTGLLMGALVDACPSGMVGGCEREDDTESFTVWFYPPNTMDDVECGSSATYVPPPS
jgi:hypothetical protein